MVVALFLANKIKLNENKSIDLIRKEAPRFAISFSSEARAQHINQLLLHKRPPQKFLQILEFIYVSSSAIRI